MDVREHAAPSLDETLDRAVDLCRRAMADYRAGLIDEGELERLLSKGGLALGVVASGLRSMATARNEGGDR
jgi:hypothetical protein